MKYLLLAGSMILAVIGQILLKAGVSASSLTTNLSSIIKTIFHPLVFSGLASYGFSALIWLFVLQRFPLSVAYPALSITYVVIVIISFYLFKEPITPTKIAGILLIIFGVYLLFR